MREPGTDCTLSFRFQHIPRVAVRNESARLSCIALKRLGQIDADHFSKPNPNGGVRDRGMLRIQCEGLAKARCPSLRRGLPAGIGSTGLHYGE